MSYEQDIEDCEAENLRLRKRIAELEAKIDRLTACPGCGKHPQGAHFCPGPKREPVVYLAPLIPWNTCD